MRDNDPISRNSWHLGFGVTPAENGAWVLTENNDYENRPKHFICPDNEALYVQMRAWVEREIVGHRQNHASYEQIESGAHLTAAREVSA